MAAIVVYWPSSARDVLAMAGPLNNAKRWARSVKLDVVALWIAARDPRTPQFRMTAAARAAPASRAGLVAIICIWIAASLGTGWMIWRHL